MEDTLLRDPSLGTGFGTRGWPPGPRSSPAVCKVEAESFQGHAGQKRSCSARRCLGWATTRRARPGCPRSASPPRRPCSLTAAAKPAGTSRRVSAPGGSLEASVLKVRTELGRKTQRTRALLGGPGAVPAARTAGRPGTRFGPNSRRPRRFVRTAVVTRRRKSASTQCLRRLWPQVNGRPCQGSPPWPRDRREGRELLLPRLRPGPGEQGPQSTKPLRNPARLALPFPFIHFNISV